MARGAGSVRGKGGHRNVVYKGKLSDGLGEEEGGKREGGKLAAKSEFDSASSSIWKKFSIENICVNRLRIASFSRKRIILDR